MNSAWYAASLVNRMVAIGQGVMILVLALLGSVLLSGKAVRLPDQLARTFQDVGRHRSARLPAYVPKLEGANTLNLLIVEKTPKAKMLVQIAIFSTISPDFNR